MYTFIKDFLKKFPTLYLFLKSFSQKHTLTYNIFYNLINLDVKVLLLTLFQYFKLFWVIARNNSIRHTNQNTNKIVMLAIAEVYRDPRIERAARTLRDKGFEITIVYIDYFSPDHNIKTIDWGPGITFKRVPYKGYTFWEYFPYFLYEPMIRAASEESAFAVHCHDLNTCLMGLIVADNIGSNFICDFHEWYSENVSWNEKHKKYEQHSYIKKNMYRWAEKICLKKSNRLITVCESIATDLSQKIFQKNIAIVRNIPSLREKESELPLKSIREDLNLSKAQFPLLLLWQGGIGPTRLIEPIIEAVALVSDVNFIIRGVGSDIYMKEYKQLARKLGITDRLHCLKPLPSSLVVAGAKGADLGVWSLPNLCKNFSYALPNKVFEYMSAGVPILAADYPEVRNLITTYDIGLLFDPYDPKSIAKQIETVKNSPALLKTFQHNLIKAMKENDPDQEWGKLADLYQGLLAEGK